MDYITSKSKVGVLEIGWSEILGVVKLLSKQVYGDVESGKIKSIYGIPRGGSIVSALLVQSLNNVFTLRLIESEINIASHTLIVDDICDSGNTLNKFKKRYPHNKLATLYCKTNSSVKPNYYSYEVCTWIKFPWEKDNKNTTIEENVIRVLEYIGEDPNREGLQETPKRVVRMYNELFAGYDVNRKPEMKTFTSTNTNLQYKKWFTVYSMCEHHMVPIEFKVAIGYVPNGKVIGISKLIRLIRWKSARLVIQENLAEEIVEDLMKMLKPQGAMIVMEGKHFCECMRGVKVENYSGTSAIRGIFESYDLRTEFLRLINNGGRE